MTTRRDREEQAYEIIRPFIEEWLEKTGVEFEAFRNWAVEQILWDENLSAEQVEEAANVDGPGDMGIDAWHLSSDGASKVLYLLQSKDTRATRDDLLKLRDGFLDLLDPTKSVNSNGEVRARAAELHQEIDDGMRIEFHLATSKSVARNLQTEGEPLFTDFVDVAGHSLPASFFVHDVEDLAANLRLVQEQPINATFTLAGGEYFEYITESKFKTVSAAIKADELALLFNRNRLNLFRLNPRYYLSRKSAVNKEVLQTLQADDSSNFYLYNNGLTATGTAVNINSHGESETLDIRDFQIVNGCQTTVTLYERWKEGGSDPVLAEVRVPIRIIETQAAQQMADTVARTTNRQNQMRNEDFRSGEPVHVRLRAEFDRLEPRWFYEHKRGTWNTEYRTRRAKAPYLEGPFAPRRIQMKDLAQACLAFQGRPDDATGNVGAFFDSEDLFKSIFPDRCQAEQLLLPHILFLKASEIAKSHAQEWDWSTSYLRYPMVAGVSRLISFMLDESSSGSYLPVGISKELIEANDRWAPDLFEWVFEELAKHVNEEAKSGRGVRTIVRRRDYLEGVVARASQRATDILSAEMAAAAAAGINPDQFGVRSKLPGIKK